MADKLTHTHRLQQVSEKENEASSTASYGAPSGCTSVNGLHKHRPTNQPTNEPTDRQTDSSEGALGSALCSVQFGRTIVSIRRGVVVVVLFQSESWPVRIYVTRQASTEEPEKERE